MDDGGPIAESVTEAMEAVIYAKDCKNQIGKLPAPLTITVKPDTALGGVTVPTEAAVSAGIAR